LLNRAPTAQLSAPIKLEVLAVGIREPMAYIGLYGSLYAGFGVASPFWPKYFETRGLEPQQIGLILAAAMLVRLVSGPLLGTLADSLAALRFVLAVCTSVSAVAALALMSADRFWALLVVALLQAAALAPTTSIVDALAVNVASPRIGYGWLRGSASAAFVVGTLSAGQLISAADLSPVIWMNATLLMAAAATTAFLPNPPGRAASQREPSFSIVEIKALLGISRFRMVILVSALVYGSHAV
jgi:MFS transporter, PPP family, 3-phenylpropionic acid transporter